MQLTSPAFLAFLVCVYLAFWLLHARRPLAYLLIIAANYLFYAPWGWIYLAAVPICSFCDYLLARGMSATSQVWIRRALLAASLLLNLGLTLSTKLPASAVPIALPLSLSFYGFQALTYTIEVYRRDIEPSRSLLSYLASVSFFPTTLAGPITRVGYLAPQWAKVTAPLDNELGGRALFLIGLGAAKKFLIADYLAQNLVNRVFDTPALYSGAENLLGVYGYAFQLYYDFSGYSDIAIGSALLLGVKLPANFNRPYESTSVADFWRRWHITFSNWLRDYLFYSLPGPRGRVLPYLNLVITMVLGGLWHGLTLGFLSWGVLHGVALAATRAFQALCGRRAGVPPWYVRLFCRVLTFHYVCLGWIFFRAESFEAARDILGQIASATIGFANVTPQFAGVLALGATLHFLPAGWYSVFQRRFAEAPALVQGAALTLLVLGIRFWSASAAAPFVYQRF
jgi:D-alanyl-lipoteichoic acid acyltransferase DltB (MBOAT superfamily)